MIHLWEQMRHYGARHGVDPRLFAAIYVARLPFLLLALGSLARRARRGRPVLAMALLFLALGILPYTYVLAFGWNLPAWFVALVAPAAALTIAQGARNFRTALRREAPPPPLAARPTSGEPALHEWRSGLWRTKET